MQECSDRNKKEEREYQAGHVESPSITCSDNTGTEDMQRAEADTRQDQTQSDLAITAEMQQRSDKHRPQVPTYRQLMDLYESQGQRCALSGLPLVVNADGDNMAIDHRVSIEAGGGHDISNLQWLRKDVNRMKGTMSEQDFIAICHHVANTHDLL